MTTPAVNPRSAAGKVLTQLRHGAMTVEQLARGLHLTDNAVRNQLRNLEEMGLARRTGTRPGTSKPSALYGITLEGQVQFSKLYLPVLTQFLQVAEDRCSKDQLDSFMTATGQSLARKYPKPTGAMKKRAHAAARLLKSFGGVAEVRARNGTLTIQSVACPLAALTSENPVTCLVLQGFLSTYLSAPITVCCDLREQPQCCFEVRA